MRRAFAQKHGAKIELGDNLMELWDGIMSLFRKKKDNDKKK